MIRYTALSALPLAALSLLPFAGAAAHAEAASRPALIAQAGPPPQLEQAVPEEVAPEEDNKDRKGKRGRSDREDAPPAPAANVPAEIEKQGPPPQGRKEKHKKSAGEAVNPTQGPPPAAVGEKKRRDRGDDGPPREEPAKAAAPAEQPTEPPQEKRRQKQAEPREADQPQLQPEPQREPEKAAAPPPKEQPKAQPVETKRQPPETKSQETMAPPPARERRQQRAGSDGNMDDVKKHRRQRTEDGGKRTVIEEPGNRVIVKEGGQTTIRHDETERLRRTSRDVRREKAQGRHQRDDRCAPRRHRGLLGVRTTAGTSCAAIAAARTATRSTSSTTAAIAGTTTVRHGGIGFYLDLRPPRIGIPRNRYIVEYDNASEEDVYDALMAPPVEELDRGYTLDEIRYNRNLRDRMRRIDLDTVNFAFGIVGGGTQPVRQALPRGARDKPHPRSPPRRDVPRRGAHRRGRLRHRQSDAVGPARGGGRLHSDREL